MLTCNSLNAQAYSRLFEIENTLRVFITDSLEKKVGPRWFKDRLPPDLAAKYAAGVAYERGIKWQELRPHHPIFYLDFPDLRKIMDRKDNWNQVFAPYFGSKELLMSSLASLEPVRNRIAHNRYLDQEDLDRLRVCSAMIRSALSVVPLPQASRWISPSSIRNALLLLRDNLRVASDHLNKLEAMHQTDYWCDLQRSWWFDSDYLGGEISELSTFVTRVLEYALLPRERGQGYLIEQWVRGNQIATLEAASLAELANLLQEERHQS